MFSTDLIFRQQENLVDNQKCQARFRPLCNKIPLYVRVRFYNMSVTCFHEFRICESMNLFHKSKRINFSYDICALRLSKTWAKILISIQNLT